MARNIGEIKSEMAREFMRNESAAERYGFEPGTAFGDVFGAASVENILLYVWAVCAWTVEQLVARHKKEVTAELEGLIAHRPKWYRDKVLHFMEGKELVEDSDTYDTASMSESEITAARVVKHAVATESRDASLLTRKRRGAPAAGCGAGAAAESLYKRDQGRGCEGVACEYGCGHVRLHCGCVL